MAMMFLKSKRAAWQGAEEQNRTQKKDSAKEWTGERFSAGAQMGYVR